MNVTYVVSPELYQRCTQMCLAAELLNGQMRADGHVWILQDHPKFEDAGWACYGYRLSDVLLRVIEQTEMKGV